MNELHQWGLSDRFIELAGEHDGWTIARVVQQQRSRYTIVCKEDIRLASVSGRFQNEVKCPSQYPAVGDWVMVSLESEQAVIHKVLDRKSCFERKAAGRRNEAQVVAANIDLVFICMALNQDFNVRRLERYLSVAWSSGATPVIVLTKADLCPQVKERLAEVEQIAFGVGVILCSNALPEGYDQIAQAVLSGKTIAFIGASGVGKSTVINHLKDVDLIKTNEIRQDGKGRHTTTHRQLYLLPNGGMVIDTPGMRELGIETAEFSNAFADIEELIQQCKYSNCTHTSEPGCAVTKAVREGLLEEGRFANYQKLQAEAAYSEMNSRQIDEEKISRMFGSKSMMKKRMSEAKAKNNRR
jgi:ribosome biogenesis GTPase / thiamine phosphate phosphatase